MAEVKPPPGPPEYAMPVPAGIPASEKELYVQQTPVWVVVLRGLQIFVSLPILIMAGILIHGVSLGANAFAVACVVFTWVVATYVLVAEKVKSANVAYNIWAVLALDLLMAIFWLASMGANAALRAQFKDNVNVQSCFENGQITNSRTCTFTKRDPNALADQAGLAMISAIAGLSALQFLLFIPTLVFHGHSFRMWHQANKKPSVDNATVEMKAQGTPMLAAQPTTGPVYPQYSDSQQYQPHPQYTPQAELQGNHDPQQTANYPQPQQPAFQPAIDPSTQQYAAYPDPNNQGYQAQPQSQPPYDQHSYSTELYSPHGTPAPYSPHGTPAPGQPYYPPQQSTVSSG